MAWEMLIVYARCLTRDVEFDGWETDATVVALTAAMNAVLQSFPGEIDPRMPVDAVTGLISPANLLRNVYEGEEVGAFWNQLQMFPTFTVSCLAFCLPNLL